MVSISPGKMRQINDPVLQILQQVHHVIFLSQVHAELCYLPIYFFDLIWYYMMHDIIL